MGRVLGRIAQLSDVDEVVFGRDMDDSAGEADEVRARLGVACVDASDRFMRALAGVTAVEIFAAGEACAATDTKSTRRRLSQRFRSVAQTPTDSASTMTSVGMRGLDSGGPSSFKFSSNDGGRGAVLDPPVRMIILPSCGAFCPGLQLVERRL